MARLSWPARLYIGAIVAAAVVLLVRGPFGGVTWWREVAVLGVLLLVFESTATLLRPRELAWSPSPIATLAAVVLVGPVGAALVGACTVFGLRRGPSLVQRAVQHRHARPVRVPGREGLHRRARARRHARVGLVPGDHRALRGRGRGARGREPRAARRRALADQRAAPRGDAAPPRA